MKTDKLISFGNLLSRIRQNNAEEFYQNRFEKLIEGAGQENAFFTRQNITDALDTVAFNLTSRQLNQFQNTVVFNPNELPVRFTSLVAEKDVLSGFPDWIMAMLNEKPITFQLPENNRKILPELISWYVKMYPEEKPMITFTEGQVKTPEMLLTYPLESSETYLRKYFEKYPGKVRKKQKAAAVITGEESDETLALLADGIMKFFNQGAHRISRLFVPEGYKLDKFMAAFEKWNHLKDHHLYKNNYDYYKSVYLLNQEEFYDNELILMKHDEQQILSPLSVIYFSYYTDAADWKSFFEREELSGIYAAIKDNCLPFEKVSLPEFHRWENYSKLVSF